jgi:hypothetical protein
MLVYLVHPPHVEDEKQLQIRQPVSELVRSTQSTWHRVLNIQHSTIQLHRGASLRGGGTTSVSIASRLLTTLFPTFYLLPYFTPPYRLS